MSLSLRKGFLARVHKRTNKHQKVVTECLQGPFGKPLGKQPLIIFLDHFDIVKSYKLALVHNTKYTEAAKEYKREEKHKSHLVGKQVNF